MKTAIPHKARAAATRGGAEDALLVGKAELARKLSVSEKTIDRWRAEGFLPPPVIDTSGQGRRGKVLWSMATIKAWITAGCPHQHEPKGCNRDEP